MGRLLRPLVLVLAAISPASAETVSFDSSPPHALPAGWLAGATGSGEPRWEVVADPTAPSPPNVLEQSGQGRYPWCVRPGAQLADGFVETRFAALAGKEDQAGGVVWRWKDGDSYYVARANALEKNVSLYYTSGGTRHTLEYAEAPVEHERWHTLRVEFAGTRITVLLDGKLYIALDDEHLLGPGAVGLWTKADSVTAFDDFAYGPLAAQPRNGP